MNWQEKAVIIGISYRNLQKEEAEVEVQMPNTSSWQKQIKIQLSEEEKETVKNIGINAYKRYVEDLKSSGVEWHSPNSATTKSL